MKEGFPKDTTKTQEGSSGPDQAATICLTLPFEGSSGNRSEESVKPPIQSTKKEKGKY